MSKDGKTADYTVGFGKPPTEHRFKKGQSGNPKGRPKKVAEKQQTPRFGDGLLNKLFEQEAFRRLHLHENGKPVEMNAVQAVLRSLMVEGLKGNRLAKKYVFELLRQQEREAIEQSVELYKYFAQKKAEGEAKIAQCKAQMCQPSRFYPHPDDILLDEAKIEVHILGPRSENEAIPYVGAALVRDWFFARSVFDRKYGTLTPFVWEDLRGDSASEMIAFLIEHVLPPSFRRSDGETCTFMLDLMGLSKRQLLQRMEALIAEVASLPPTIEERLAARRRAPTVLETLAEALKVVATTLAEKQRQASAGDATGGQSQKPQAAPA